MPDASAPDTTRLYEEWSLHDASLFAEAGDALRAKSAYYGADADELRACLDHAASVVDVDAPDGRGRVVPLHREDDAAPTVEYVRWNPDAGTVGWHDPEFGVSGTARYADVDDVIATEVAWRVRFWHPDYAPGDDPFGDVADPPSAVEASDPLSGTDRRAFFDDLRGVVRDERRAERDANWADHADADLGRLVGRGVVDGPFVLVATEGAYGSGRPAELRVQYAPDDGVPADVDLVAGFDLYPDNRVVVDAFDSAFPVPARIASVDGPVVTLQPEWENVDDPSRVADAAEDADPFWLRTLLNPVPYDRRREALDAVWEAPAKRRLLTGERDLSFGALPSARRSGVELNDYQLRALGWAVAADDVACIHGPPGTGKTRTLTAFVAHAVARGERVLVTAHSNQAVDNLLVGDSTLDEREDGTLHAAVAGEDVRVARYGRHSRNRVVGEHYRETPIDDADVVAATTNGAAAFDQDDFDVAVVDEATQASRAATAIALNAAEKLVLAGDHRQLPPYSVTEAGEGEMRPSLFETLVDRYGDEVAVLLRRQYRMHDAIAAFPNEAFYGGRLETADANADWTIPGFPPVSVVDVEGDERREERGSSVRNAAEADAVAERVDALLDAGADPTDVGVIAAYSGQVREIRSRLGDLDRSTHGLTVDTVDSFQGGERDAIVVSFARSNDAANAGFLEHPEEGPRRLNVALTRARKHLALVGDRETLTTRATHRDPEDSCADTYAALFETLAERPDVEHTQA
ncbi:AAA domain-containing protein [Halobacterium litoreum]|uniref:AAA domain-containing protein n=1 Tax=Halobacterium litoreum TaxID=2039234 RepID=A0ABD5NEP7_9EURY|nr:AAA domain-containing protein [Halobacterium litoreum]UHH13503.1 AAA domain-containing protein [Halobacterium litoreum]